jgi:hypothetical protein
LPLVEILEINSDFLQGELEHRTAKARYKRTDRKLFVKQLAQIERRQARLRRIKAKLSPEAQARREAISKEPQQHHHIGRSQNQYEHIGTFLRRHAGDPAVMVCRNQRIPSCVALTAVEQDFLPKLQEHLLPRILSTLQSQTGAQSNNHMGNSADINSVLFKHDRIYQHNLIRINYTTYDVRRAQDVVNSSTSHRNVMVLASPNDDHPALTHPFRYARVLGTYHVNVVYVGPGMLDYQPQQMEFLWVRWYQPAGVVRTGWDARKLHRIRFSPMGVPDAFGFINPLDVLRSCHVIPAFSKGQVHDDGKGLSFCAQDSTDWAEYYVNR